MTVYLYIMIVILVVLFVMAIYSLWFYYDFTQNWFTKEKLKELGLDYWRYELRKQILLLKFMIFCLAWIIVLNVISDNYKAINTEKQKIEVIQK